MLGAGVGAAELVGGAFEKVAHLARRAVAAQFQQVQVGHAAHRQVVVPVPVLRFAGDVAGLLARLEFPLLLRLRLGAFQFGPDPADEDQALAVGQPAQAAHAGGHLSGAPRFAAIGGDEVELRALVLDALLFTLGGEGDEVAARAPARLAVLVAAARQLARLAAQGGQQPQRRGRLVVGHRIARQRGHRLRAVGRQAGCAQAFDLPQVLDGEVLLLRHGSSPGPMWKSSMMRGNAHIMKVSACCAVCSVASRGATSPPATPPR